MLYSAADAGMISPPKSFAVGNRHLQTPGSRCKQASHEQLACELLSHGPEDIAELRSAMLLPGFSILPCMLQRSWEREPLAALQSFLRVVRQYLSSFMRMSFLKT